MTTDNILANAKKHILVGKTITKIEVTEDKQGIRFTTSDGEIIAKCSAECCSDTWVESIELPVNGLPALVAQAMDIDLNADKDDQNGTMAYYGFKIFTDKGEIIIDYRNESNGYYGGDLAWPEDYQYGRIDIEGPWCEVKSDI